MPNSLVDAALDYAGKGWKVFPCKPDKSPYTLNGFKDATTDAKQIRAWWERWPDAWIGCPCKVNHTLVIDIDNKDGRNGSAEWAGLVHQANGEQWGGSTRIQSTVNGGFHLFFRHPAIENIPKHPAGKEGIDTRSNHYVILTPSPGYAWSNGFGPDNELTDPPGWLIDLLQNPPAAAPTNGKSIPFAYSDNGAKWLREAISKAHIGTRDDCGFDLACQLRDDGISLDQAKDIMRQYARAVPQAKGKPYTERKAEASAMSAYNQPPREPARNMASSQMTPSRGVTATGEAATGQLPPQPNQFRRWSIGELLDTDFPDPRWAIPDIIPEGLTVIAGRPKVGKSWMMLQAAWTVGAGGMFLNQQAVKGQALYIALEDSPRRLRDRIRDMGITRDAQINFQTKWRPLHKGGLDDLLIDLTANTYRLIIIDTLTRSIPGIDQKTDAGTIGKVFDELQRMAMAHNTAIVLVDHTRKPGPGYSDPIDDVLHSSEKTEIADVILAIYKSQGKPGAQLQGRGREIAPIEYDIEFDVMTRCWQIKGGVLTERTDEILDALQALGRAQIGEIAKLTGQQKGNVYTRLITQIEAGRVKRETIGRNVYYELV